MSLLYDAMVDGIIFCGISVPFIIINILLIKIIYKNRINSPMIFFILGAMLSTIFVFGITCYSDIHYETFDIKNILLKMNLNVFSSIKECFIMSLAGDMGAILNLYGNIIIFIPIGFFTYGINMFGKKFRKLKVTITCCLISLFIELFQVSFNRIGDINDIILNTFGGFIGCLLFLFLNNIFDINNKLIKKDISLIKKILILIITVFIWFTFMIISAAATEYIDKLC